MPLSAEVVAARVAWRVALLRVVAAWTFAQLSRHGQQRPCPATAAWRCPSPPTQRISSWTFAPSRKPSCLISCTQFGQHGVRSAGEGRHGWLEGAGRVCVNIAEQI